MYWPFKTTVVFVNDVGTEQRLRYAVSAEDSAEAKRELQRRLLAEEIFGYAVESVTAATVGEAANLKLPAGCIQLLA